MVGTSLCALGLLWWSSSSSLPRRRGGRRAADARVAPGGQHEREREREREREKDVQQPRSMAWTTLERSLEDLESMGSF